MSQYAGFVSDAAAMKGPFYSAGSKKRRICSWSRLRHMGCIRSWCSRQGWRRKVHWSVLGSEWFSVFSLWYLIGFWDVTQFRFVIVVGTMFNNQILMCLRIFQKHDVCLWYNRDSRNFSYWKQSIIRLRNFKYLLNFKIAVFSKLSQLQPKINIYDRLNKLRHQNYRLHMKYRAFNPFKTELFIIFILNANYSNIKHHLTQPIESANKNIWL